MKWTSTKPTRPGWYWWRNASSCEDSISLVVYVEITPNGVGKGCVSFAYGERYRQLKQMNGEWAGPLEPPGEKR